MIAPGLWYLDDGNLDAIRPVFKLAQLDFHLLEPYSQACLLFILGFDPQDTLTCIGPSPESEEGDGPPHLRRRDELSFSPLEGIVDGCLGILQCQFIVGG